jgi:peptide/nickel transport system substrate-binding protein
VTTSTDQTSSSPSPGALTRSRPSGPALGRRGFLGLGLGAGGSLLLAACGGSTTKSGSAAAAATGAPSGTITWAWDLPTTWDPITSSAGWDVHVLSLVYAGLTQEDEKGNAIPAVATGWQYNADGTQITFKLRSGLKFSDGTALDATAVQKSVLRGRDAENSLIASQLVTVKNVTAPDPLTVVIDLTEPNYQIPTLFAGKTGMIVSPAAFTENAGALALQPVGAGPFTLTSYTENAKATLVRNPGFWNAAEIRVANFNLLPLPDGSTVVAGLESGQYNVASIPGNVVASAKAAGLQVQVIPSLVVAVLDINNTIAPFDDPKVVEALKFAVDRAALLQTAQFGYGEVAYQPFPEGYVGYNPSIGDIYAYNQNKAKALLAESKYGANPKVAITTTVAAGVPEQLQAQLQAVGFDATIEVIPAAQATEVMYIQHSRALSVDAFAGRDSAAQAFQVLFGTAGLLNPGRNAPADLLTAVNKISEIPLGSADYPKALQAATELAVKEMPNVFLYTEPRILARASGVSAIPPYTVAQRFEGVTVT